MSRCHYLHLDRYDSHFWTRRQVYVQLIILVMPEEAATLLLQSVVLVVTLSQENLTTCRQSNEKTEKAVTVT